MIRISKNKNYKKCKLPKPMFVSDIPKIIAFGDIHGDLNLVYNLLRISNLATINPNGKVKWIGGRTVLVQVGDQIDRCRDTETRCATDPLDENSDIEILELFTNLHKQAKKYGGAVYSLLGNHELMNVAGDMRYVSVLGDNYSYKNISGLEARKLMFKPGEKYAKFLAYTRYPFLIIDDIMFVHGGMLDRMVNIFDIKTRFSLNQLSDVITDWLLGKKAKTKTDEDLRKLLLFTENSSPFWARELGTLPPDLSHTRSECQDHLSVITQKLGIKNIVIGHTYRAFTNKKIAIDSTCSNIVYRVDNAASNGFNFADSNYIETNVRSQSRMPQCLEIINSKQFRVLT